MGDRGPVVTYFWSDAPLKTLHINTWFRLNWQNVEWNLPNEPIPWCPSWATLIKWLWPAAAAACVTVSATHPTTPAFSSWRQGASPPLHRWPGLVGRTLDRTVRDSGTQWVHVQCARADSYYGALLRVHTHTHKMGPCSEDSAYICFFLYMFFAKLTFFPDSSLELLLTLWRVIYLYVHTYLHICIWMYTYTLLHGKSVVLYPSLSSPTYWGFSRIR